jgi:ATP-dependent Zn protease
MAATNIVEVLDQALLRAGRFDRQLTIDAPDQEGRKDIIEYYLSKVRHEDMPIDRMAADTIGYTPVTIKYIINEATVVAHFNGHDAITYADFTEARESHEWGIKQPIRGMKLEEKRRIAYHEAGHAFAMAMLLKDKARISKATIVRHGRALGMVAPKPVEERYTETKEEILAEIQVCLASRAAEELFLGTQMTGVTSDFQQATRLAQAYIGIFGMGDSFYSYLASAGMMSGLPDKVQVERLLSEQYRRVKTLLSVHSESVHAIAQALIANGELIGEDIQRIIEEKERERQSQDPSTQEDTRRLAYHEAGHAIAGALLDRRREVSRVSIVAATDNTLGFSERRPITECQTNSREELLSMIQIKLAGRASEEMFLGTLLDGAVSDLDYARATARFIIEYMSPAETLFYFDPERDDPLPSESTPQPVGAIPAPVPQGAGPDGPGGSGGLGGIDGAEAPPEELRSRRRGDWEPEFRLRRQMGKLLMEQYDSVKRLLRENEKEVHDLARALAERGELEAADVRRILNGKLPSRAPQAALEPPLIALPEAPSDPGIQVEATGD